ncbi:MAG: GNAT family N-acetyltransferase [Anaerolineaceae bacterium]|nr:GNAT family N-acetyltransferase [Anaerolineaceae bacterium]
MGNDHSAFLKGSQVYLRPIEKDDLKQLYVWFNDPEIRALTGEVFPTSQTGMEEFLSKIQADTSRVWFGIVLQENDQLIGETGLLRMFPAWRNTDLSIIIGEKSKWGKGYGNETMELLLDYAFGYLNFHRVAIGVVGTNERALRFYERIGFKREGIQRDGYYYAHKYQDFVMMSLLEDEYREMRNKGN